MFTVGVGQEEQGRNLVRVAAECGVHGCIKCIPQWSVVCPLADEGFDGHAVQILVGQIECLLSGHESYKATKT